MSCTQTSSGSFDRAVRQRNRADIPGHPFLIANHLSTTGTCLRIEPERTVGPRRAGGLDHIGVPGRKFLLLVLHHRPPQIVIDHAKTAVSPDTGSVRSRNRSAGRRCAARAPDRAACAGRTHCATHRRNEGIRPSGRAPPPPRQPASEVPRHGRCKSWSPGKGCATLGTVSGDLAVTTRQPPGALLGKIAGGHPIAHIE